MRRIPRLRRPSGLPSTPTTINVSRTTASPFTTVQCSRSRQRPTATATPTPTPTPFHPPNLNRFYSSSSSDKQQTPTPVPERESEREQVQELEKDQDKELQVPAEAARTADALLAESEDLVWAEEDEGALAQGPYGVPPPRVEAARMDEVADPTYTPAETAKGLKKVGGLADWWSRPENWHGSGDFTSFRPREKVTDPVLIDAAVRRAVVEALALREVGREEDLVAIWPVIMPKSDLQGLLAHDVKSTEDGVATLHVDISAVAEGLRLREDGHLFADSDGQDPSAEALTSEEVSALAQTWDPSWRSISLADPRLRFAVTKRVFQLTGQLVPDHQLPSIKTVQILLRSLKKPPKPATLAEEVQKRHPDLLELPNVTIAAKRVTRGDKEKALGRFKLMQEEFKKRDIPGLGHGYARKGKDVKRVQGVW